MTLAQEDLQFTPEGLEVTALESDNLKDYETKRGGVADLIRGYRGYLVGLTFVAGLLLGWLVIGWWLWPVQWTNTDPWQLRTKYQRTFVSLVAEDYWQTRDISRAREALAGWDAESLAKLLATMENQSSSPEEQQHLAALAEALEMPQAGWSLTASLLSQKTILLASILTASPLVVATALAAYSLVQNRTQRAGGLLSIEGQIEEELEELMAQGEGPQGEGQDQEGGMQEQEGEEQDQEEILVEGEEKEEDYEEDAYEEDDEEENDPWVQDFVSDLFDDEDEDVTRLAELCKKLPDIDVPALLEHSKELVNDLRRANALRQG
jgi:hypothetical protein